MAQIDHSIVENDGLMRGSRYLPGNLSKIEVGRKR